jgi:hypothetical protein
LEQCRVREVLIAGKIVAQHGVSEVKETGIELPRQYDALITPGTTACGGDVRNFEREIDSYN